MDTSLFLLMSLEDFKNRAAVVTSIFAKFMRSYRVIFAEAAVGIFSEFSGGGVIFILLVWVWE